MGKVDLEDYEVEGDVGGDIMGDGGTAHKRAGYEHSGVTSLPQLFPQLAYWTNRIALRASLGVAASMHFDKKPCNDRLGPPSAPVAAVRKSRPMFATGSLREPPLCCAPPSPSR